MHIGIGATQSTTEVLYFPPPRRLNSDADKSWPDVLDNLVNPVGFIDFTTEYICLGSIVRSYLTSDEEVGKRIRSASAAVGAH
jgi:N-acetylneuraminic acid mutarotase